MAQRLKLFLIRHGETVDNIAQVYAGSRDSALTNHGYQQATRLGQHFKSRGLSFTHIFSSHLQRAAKTAGLVRDGQLEPAVERESARIALDVVQLPVLMEQDFGSCEGKKWHQRPVDLMMASQDTEDFVDFESNESMAQRADAFIDAHLFPLLHGSTEPTELVVAVVSHGIMLSSLWKRFLLRLPPRSITLSPELAATARLSLEHLGGWSNTGYLELHMTQEHAQESVDAKTSTLLPSNSFKYTSYATPMGSAAHTLDAPQATKVQSIVAPSNSVTSANPTSVVDAQPAFAKLANGWTTVIKTINGRDHLKGLKRTGGGVGSARHDASQKNIETFFKRQKLE